MIKVSDLSISYNTQKVLEDISFNIQPGEWVLVSGPSGCGKSTLARALSGLIPHALSAKMEGSVQIAGRNTREHSLLAIAQCVGLVFQNPSTQLFHLRVEDEISFGPRNLGFDEVEVQKRTNWALEATGLAELRNHKPNQLSGGQKQSVAIAAVLAMRPQVLVLDEPTASLDIPSTIRIMNTLSILKENYGITIVMIEHRLADALQRADRILLLEDGKIIADGSPDTITSNHSMMRTLGLRRPAQEPLSPWRSLIQENGNGFHKDEPLLRLENVSAGYDRRTVIHNINLSIYPGDFTALVGDNGAGKSTVALVAAGLHRHQGGRVWYQGRTKRQPGLDVSLLFQNPREQLFTDTVDEEVAFGPQNYACFNPEKHLEILEQADLLSLRNRRPTILSTGQQQRTTLAACVALRPKLVILDEPTLGQDWGHLQQLMNFLKQLNRQGTAILLISHDYKLIHRYAQRVVLMEDGRIKLRGYLPQKKESSHEI